MAASNADRLARQFGSYINLIPRLCGAYGRDKLSVVKRRCKDAVASLGNAMTYRAPVADILYSLEHVAGFAAAIEQVDSATSISPPPRR